MKATALEPLNESCSPTVRLVAKFASLSPYTLVNPDVNQYLPGESTAIAPNAVNCLPSCPVFPPTTPMSCGVSDGYPVSTWLNDNLTVPPVVVVNVGET